MIVAYLKFVKEVLFLNRIEKLLEYIYSLEKTVEGEGYDKKALGYNDEVEKAIGELSDKGSISV